MYACTNAEHVTKTTTIFSLFPLASCRSLHTSPALDARIKNRATHKSFWHIKKTNKALDDPITSANRDFLEQCKVDAYVDTRVDVGGGDGGDGDSPLRADLTPWPRGEWLPDERFTRCGLIGRKIGMQPMWLKNGKKVMSTLVQVEDNHVIKYLTPGAETTQSVATQRRAVPHGYKDGRSVNYGCLVVGALSGDPERFTKDYCGLFTDTGLVRGSYCT